MRDCDSIRKLRDSLDLAPRCSSSPQVLASLQSRVVSLSSIVKGVRAGLQSKLRSWLGARSALHGNSGSPTSNSPNPSSVRYAHGSIEAQTRQLADCAFFLGDYATALTAYRQVANDFKSDKAWWHYAATVEMIALCRHICPHLHARLLLHRILNHS